MTRTAMVMLSMMALLMCNPLLFAQDGAKAWMSSKHGALVLSVGTNDDDEAD